MATHALTFVSGSTKSRAVAETTANVALAAQLAPYVSIVNIGAKVAYIELGASTVEATTAGLPILVGERVTVMRNPTTQTHIAAIAAAGETSTVLASLAYGE